MPLDNYFTKPDYSRQLKQYSGTSATFSGTTNILQAFYVKSVEIDTTGAVLSDALLFDGIKFRPAQPGGFSGSVITNGFNLSYVSGLTYRVSAGTYRFNNTIYPYIGEDFNIISGQSGGSRFDLVYISGGSVSISVRTGTTTTNPTVPNLQLGELEVGIIFVPVNFTGGTGSTIIQTTAATVFEYYNNGSGNGIQRTAVGANTQAVGSFSFAVGRDSDAYAPDSVTLGVDTKASGNSQTVVGTFNIPTTTDYFIVGYGADDSNRANAFNITNSGDTYANRKLFVTNVEIETTGATNGKVLKFNGTKFTPQLETITGATSFTGGTSIFSSITNNTLLFKSITGGSNIFLTESGGTIYVNVEFSGVTSSGVTQIESLAGGVSIISGKTGSTYFLYPLQGSGGTQVVLSDNKLVIYSDTSASTTGDNVGPIAAAGVFKEKFLNQLRFRRLTSTTSNYLTITESTGLNELVLFTSTPPITGSTNATGGTVGVLGTVTDRNIIGRTLSGTNRISLTQASDVITINSPIEVETGDIATLSIYRSSSPVVYSSYTTTNISGITIKLGTHTTPITSRTYTIPDVKKDANFVMTEGNQTINGKKEFISGITIGNDPQTSLDQFDEQFNHNIYNLFQPNDNKLEFFETISGISYISEKIYADNGTKLLADSISGLSILKNSYYQFTLTSNVSGTAIGNLENINFISNGRDTNIVGKYNIYNFNDNPSSNYNSKLIGNYFESRVKTALVAQTIESFKTIQLGYFNSVLANSPIKRAYDIYITKPLVETGFSAPLITSFASIYIEGKTTPPNSDIFKRNIKQTSNTSFTNAPWSLFAEDDRAYIGNTLVLASGITLSSTTRGAWLDLGASQLTRPHINFSSGTAPTSPQIGDLWWNGTQLYFRKDGSTSVDLLSNTSGGTSGITDGQNSGSGVQVFLSSGTGNLYFRTLTSATPSQLSITQSGNLVIFSSNTSGSSSVTLSSAGTGNILLLSSITNNNLIHKSISAGTGMNITESNGTLIFTSTATGGTGSTLTGDYLPLSGGTLTGGLSGTTISATSIDRINYIDFNTGATVTSQTARLNWNNTDGTLDLGLKGGNVTLQIGQEQVVRVVNKTSGNLLESQYKVVRIRRQSEGGTAGQRLAIVLAQGNNDPNSVDTLGIVTENIDNNQEGFITSSGLVRGINTTGSLQSETWNDGDVLYLSPTTAGQLTTTKPQAPNHSVIMGYVVYAHINNGKIFVKVDNGYELDELHNVRITSASDYNILRYDGVTYSSWTNSTLNEVLSKTLLTANIPVTSQVAQVNTFFLYDKLTITASTSAETVTAITSDVSISAYTPSIKFFANTGVTVTFRNSTLLKTEGGLDAVIVGDNYDSITFTYNNNIQKYFQTNINNYI